MAEQRAIRSEDFGEPLGPDGSTRSDKIPERLYGDYERLRVELARLRKDVRRLSEAREIPDADEAPAGESPKGGIAAAIASHPIRFVLVLVALAVAASGGRRLWEYAKTYQSTDDAQINAHIDPISPRISGTVLHVYVDDNQYVRAGQPLADIDPSGYRIAVAKARAGVAAAQGQLLATEENAAEAKAMMIAAQDTAEKAASDARRFSELRKDQIISQHEMDQYVTDSRVAAAQTAAASAAWHSLSRDLASRKAAVQAARAALNQALLDLSYTKIIAPVSGIVGKRSVEVGQRVQPGEELLAIVRDEDLWVTANFKETQLERIRPGQRATIYVDAFERSFTGEVRSIAGASGAKYSILPPENATGNYVKVVQRIPVRIRLRSGQPLEERLRAGMSVEATVWLR
jgi:membrane fusion protein, multidrug efflux system